MPVYPNQKNLSSILKNIRTNLGNRAGITNFERDSKARALADAIAQEIIELQTGTRASFESSDETLAAGNDLVRLAKSRHGVNALTSLFAQATVAEQNVIFYVETGTFGDINSAADITIPVNTIIYSQPSGNELGRTIQYKVLEAVTLNAATSVGAVAVKATVAGSIANVGKGVLNLHSFTAYTDVANNTLKVRNNYGILNGRDPESDSQLRSRIAARYQAIQQSNQARISLSALEVPGVVALKIIPGYFGVGTAGVIVLGPDNQTTAALVAAVQARCDQFKSPASHYQAIAATAVTVELRMRLKVMRALTISEKSRVESEIKRILSRTLTQRGLGESIGFVELAEAVRSVTNGLISLQTRTDKNVLFDKVWIRKGGVSGTDERKLITTTSIPLQNDEYYVLGSNLEFEYIV